MSCLRPTLLHGTVTLIPRGTDRIYPGDVAKLVCDRDYELKTKDFLYSYSYIRCSDSGQWTTPHGFKLLPTCKGKGYRHRHDNATSRLESTHHSLRRIFY